MNLAIAAGVALAAFLIGAIPFGVVISRAFFKRDIRSQGSGNIGAANALRTLGWRGAVAVLVLDGCKGAVPVALVSLAGGSTVLAALAGLAAVAGHCYSPFLGGKGGKGVATSYGVLWALAWPAGVTFTIVWIAALIAAGFASAASILASIAAPAALWFAVGEPGLAYGVLAAAIIIWKHRENLARLRAGTENPLPLFAKRNRTKPPVSS